jgi:hypothetical protein
MSLKISRGRSDQNSAYDIKVVCPVCGEYATVCLDDLAFTRFDNRHFVEVECGCGEDFTISFQVDVLISGLRYNKKKIIEGNRIE